MAQRLSLAPTADQRSSHASSAGPETPKPAFDQYRYQCKLKAKSKRKFPSSCWPGQRVLSPAKSEHSNVVERAVRVEVTSSTHLAIGQGDLQDVQLLVSGRTGEGHCADGDQAQDAGQDQRQELLSARLPHGVCALLVLKRDG